MKRAITITFIFALLFIQACARPALNEDLLKTGIRNLEPDVLAIHPETYKGKLLVMGGIIANTTVTDEGTIIEALYVPVDDKGCLKGDPLIGRYIAFWPKENGILDPLIYSKNRRITVAGTFPGLRAGKIGKAPYNVPVIEAAQIHLWRYSDYYYPYYLPPYYVPYWWYPYWYWGLGGGWWR